MYSFYGGQKGQDFKINRIFSNRAEDMVNDLKARWMSPVNVGDYVFISYGDPSRMNEEDSIYNTNLQKDLQDTGKSYTNSLWQKIYVDSNLKISPDFPASDNNVYIFLNLDDKATEVGTSLKEISDIESEECFGFGYRLIACVTGTTPRIQVFHSVINIEDGDPYVTLDLTNPDTPKIKFYLQRGQRVEEIWTNVVSSQENPSVDMIIDGREYESKINGQIKKATFTTPRLDFNLPKAPSFFVGELFGLGPINFYHHIAYQDKFYLDHSEFNYEIKEESIRLLVSIAQLLSTLLISDKVVYDNEGKIEIDKKHLYNAVNDTFCPQEDGTYIFNPYNTNGIFNQEVQDAIKSQMDDLIKTYSFVKINNRWTWKIKENSEISYFDNFLNETMPRSIYDISKISYQLFEICYEISNYNSTTNKIFYIFDTQGLIYYLKDVYLKLQGAYIHFKEIINKGFIGDFYINEPTGKIYQLYEVDKKDETYIKGMYLGCITAPAPVANTITVAPFEEILEDGIKKYIKKGPEVKSTLIDEKDQNTGYYQEGFNFYLPETTDTEFVTKNVSNDKDFNISEVKPISETTQQMTIETPMPIHILTDKQNGLKLKLDGEGNVEMVYDKTIYDGPILGPGDLFFNMPTANDAQGRGYVIRYKGDIASSLVEQNPVPADWELVGKIAGTPGIPVAKAIIKVITDDKTVVDTKIYYNGINDTDKSYKYRAKTGTDGQPTSVIASKILNNDKDIVNDSNGEVLPTFNINPLNGEMVMINFYGGNEITASYWGVLVNNVWNLVAFSGNSIAFIKSEKVNEDAKSVTYSADYMDNKYIDTQMDKINNQVKITWNEWA